MAEEEGQAEMVSSLFFFPSSRDVDIYSCVKAVAAGAVIGTFGMLLANYRMNTCGTVREDWVQLTH